MSGLRQFRFKITWIHNAFWETSLWCRTCNLQWSYMYWLYQEVVRMGSGAGHPGARFHPCHLTCLNFRSHVKHGMTTVWRWVTQLALCLCPCYIRGCMCFVHHSVLVWRGPWGLNMPENVTQGQQCSWGPALFNLLIALCTGTHACSKLIWGLLE